MFGIGHVLDAVRDHAEGFILLIVGVMLLSDGGHLAHLRLFGHEVNAMSKTTFYFVITVLVLTDVVQSRYKKKLSAVSQPLGAQDGASQGGDGGSGE